MCGIAGIVDPRGIDIAELPAMADALRHRGPDGEGYALAGPDDGRVACPDRGALEHGPPMHAIAGLAHRRLSIIDLSDASAQPMVDEQGRVAVAYNGELYNYVELRRELEARGHRFRSSGDTEILLRGWLEWGPGCVEHFRGMWAFAVLDLSSRRLVLARDRFGIKPLFWTHTGGVLRFASEIKGLLAAMPTPDPDEATVGAFLLAAADTGRQTFFEGIERLAPAELLTLDLDGGAPRVSRYWQLPDATEPVAEAPQRFAELFDESVRLHTRSDVPVGTCLSGGLDSSSIVCTAARLRQQGLLSPTYRHHAFGYVPPDESVSERGWMDLVAAHAQIELTEVRPTRERFEQVLATIVDQQDEPFSSTSIVAQWFVFEAARAAGMTVMLDGQGADEVLGGYHGYLAMIASGLLSERRGIAYSRLAIDHRRRLGAWPLPWTSAATLLAGPARAALRLGAFRRSAANAPPPVGDAVTASLRTVARPVPSMPTELDALLRQQTADGGLRSLLRYEDRNSMAHSIESRVPFLDHRLVEFVFSLPPEEKVRGAETKRLLRRAMAGTLPERVRQRRDKLGFAADPGAAARFAAAYREDIVANRTAAEEAWFDAGGVAEQIDAAQRDGSVEFALWRVLNVKLWARAHWGAGVPA